MNFLTKSVKIQHVQQLKQKILLKHFPKVTNPSTKEQKTLTITKDIMNIKFVELKNFSCTGCSIESIEGFNRLWIPNLNELWIGTNSEIKIKTI